MPLILPTESLREGEDADLYCREAAQIAFVEELQTFPLIFKGGTALRLLYGNKRFSEDLDFDIAEGLADEERQQLVETIRQHFKKKESRWTKDNRIYGDTESFNFYFRAHYKAGHQKTRSVKIEISRYKDTGAVQILPLHKHTHATHIRVRTYDLDTLMTGKLNALFTRHLPQAVGGERVIQGRDIYDFIHFGKRRKIKWTLLDHYNAADPTWLVEDIQELIRLVHTLGDSITADIQRLLPAGEVFTPEHFDQFFDHLGGLNFPRNSQREIFEMIKKR